MGVVTPTRFGFDIASFVIASFCTVRNTNRLTRAKGQSRNIENRQQAGLEGFKSPNTWCLSVARLVRLNTTCLDRRPRNALHEFINHTLGGFGFWVLGFGFWVGGRGS